MSGNNNNVKGLTAMFEGFIKNGKPKGNNVELKVAKFERMIESAKNANEAQLGGASSHRAICQVKEAKRDNIPTDNAQVTEEVSVETIISKLENEGKEA